MPPCWLQSPCYQLSRWSLRHNPMWHPLKITTRWQQWPAVASAPLLAFAPPRCSREAPGESRTTAGIWALNKHVKAPSDLVLLVPFTCTNFASMTVAICRFREASHANSFVFCFLFFIRPHLHAYDSRNLVLFSLWANLNCFYCSICLFKPDPRQIYFILPCFSS